MIRYIIAFGANMLFVAATSLVSIAADAPPPGDASSAVKSIQSTADEIVAGKHAGKNQLRDPARKIGVAWAKAEPVYARNRDVLVETKVLNGAVAAFESDWKGSYSKARVDAKTMSQAAGSLLEAATPTAGPAPAASGAPATSGGSAGPGTSAPSASAASPKP